MMNAHTAHMPLSKNTVMLNCDMRFMYGSTENLRKKSTKKLSELSSELQKEKIRVETKRESLREANRNTIGLCSSIRPRKDVQYLAKGGGHAKQIL